MASVAQAQTVLRFATVAPDGTAWAHLSRDFGNDVEVSTGGAVKVKWYFGGLAGNEIQMLDRIRRGQLDGAAATAMCDELAPSLKVTQVMGLVQSREENSAVLHYLRPDLEQEMHQSGFVPLVIAGFGATILFTRDPVRSLEELRAARPWVWEHEPVLRKQLESMGLHPQPLSLEDAATAFDERRINGFFSIPMAALAYQWTSRARYFLDLRASFLDGCLVLSERAFFKLSAQQQQVLKRAGDKLARAFETISARQDEQLVGGLLQKQGVKRLDFSGVFRAEFFSDARRARDK